MTEYDYSPEAYERYLSTQRRIANWVDRTEDCRPQFANALAPPPGYMPGGRDREESDSRAKRPGRRLQRRHSQHFRRSRSPSTESSSSSGSEDYEFVPRPTSNQIRSAPGLTGHFPAHQLPWNQLPQPMVSPQRTMPPSYYGAPSYQEVKRKSRPSHLPIQPPRQYYHAPPMVYASPPVSPGVYGYPPPQPFVMMPPHAPRGRPPQVPYMYLAPPC